VEIVAWHCGQFHYEWARRPSERSIDARGLRGTAREPRLRFPGGGATPEVIVGWTRAPFEVHRAIDTAIWRNCSSILAKRRKRLSGTEGRIARARDRTSAASPAVRGARVPKIRAEVALYATAAGARQWMHSSHMTADSGNLSLRRQMTVVFVSTMPFDRLKNNEKGLAYPTRKGREYAVGMAMPTGLP
jgi:hypothetical protein